jgi:hypothetical protein
MTSPISAVAVTVMAPPPRPCSARAPTSYRHGLRNPAQHRPDDEERHSRLEHQLATEQVTKSADQRGDDRRRQQVAGDNPRLMPRPAQIGDDRRQRGGDDRLVQCRQQHAQHDRQEDEIASLWTDQRAAGFGIGRGSDLRCHACLPDGALRVWAQCPACPVVGGRETHCAE